MKLVAVWQWHFCYVEFVGRVIHVDSKNIHVDLSQVLMGQAVSINVSLPGPQQNVCAV